MSTNQSYKKRNRFLAAIASKKGPLAALVGLCVLISLRSPNFLTLDNFTNILQQISVYGLISISLTYILLIGKVDLSIGSTVAFSGCLAVSLLDSFNMHWLLAIILTIVISAFVGLFNGLFLAYTTLPPFIVTLATQMTIRGLAYILTGGYPVSSKNDTFNIIGTGRWTIGGVQIPYSVAILAIAFIVFWIVLARTKFGRYMYATGGNKEAAVHSGINVRMVTIAVYVIAACLAALAGIILASRMRSGQPTIGVGYEGEAIAASVLGGVSFGGGVGTIGATVIGTFIMGVINNGLNMLKFEYFYQLIVKGLVILFAVYFDSIKDKIGEMNPFKKKSS